jgi:hypothetical protein
MIPERKQINDFVILKHSRRLMVILMTLSLFFISGALFANHPNPSKLSARFLIHLIIYQDRLGSDYLESYRTILFSLIF